MNAGAAVLIFVLGAIAGTALSLVLAKMVRGETARQMEKDLAALLPQVAEAVLAPKAAELERAAGQELKLLGTETVGKVETTQAALREKLQEMQTRLDAYQAKIGEFEKERAGGQARFEVQLQQMLGAGAAMEREARSLRAALTTSSSVRGSWGETVLRNILDRSGLNPQIDYDLQVSLAGGDLRPDAVLHFPNGGNLAVDAKASLTPELLQALDAGSEEDRHAAFAAFAKVLRARARELSHKDYPAHLDRSLPALIMFVPSEGAFRAALDADAELFAFGQELQPRVLFASPSTLFPLLLVLAHGWQQHKASRQIHELLGEIGELGGRLQVFVKHLQGVGKAIDDAGKAFNSAGASYRTRLTPQMNRLQEHGAGWDPPPELPDVAHHPQLAESASATDSQAR
ncbi:MAG: DNA recombination protein RmuC [Terriglobales bacterium]